MFGTAWLRSQYQIGYVSTYFRHLTHRIVLEGLDAQNSPFIVGCSLLISSWVKIHGPWSLPKQAQLCCIAVVQAGEWTTLVELLVETTGIVTLGLRLKCFEVRSHLPYCCDLYIHVPPGVGVGALIWFVDKHLCRKMKLQNPGIGWPPCLIYTTHERLWLPWTAAHRSWRISAAILVSEAWMADR